MCELTGPKMETASGTLATLPIRYGVIDKTGEDIELFPAFEEAVMRARDCHQKYKYIRPFRVVRVTIQPMKETQ